MKQQLIEKLLRYVKVDTQSDPNSETFPSTMKQFDLQKILLEELQKLGIKDAELDDKCYLMATIPSNIPENHPAYGKVPVIGFVAHVDTSPDVSGANVNPQIIENYQGGDIILPADPSVIITEAENAKLKECIGHTIITTDGTTLLGSDDKSGIAAIMQLTELLLNDSSILHGDIRICFTPDEEIGQGTKYFNIEKFGAKYAYTIDGDMPGELNKETFSADAAVIRTYGRDIHPGSAKDIMVNSIRAMADIIARMPKHMAPETTEGYEPYMHPHNIEGSVSKTELKILLRDFRTDGLEEQKKILQNIIDEVQVLHPKTKIEMEVKFQYRNMLDSLEKCPEVLDNLWQAALRAGVQPYWKPIRGGTDGSRLTEMGLPTPNIYTGGQNFHSKTEWVSIDALQKTVETMIELCKIYVEKSS